MLIWALWTVINDEEEATAATGAATAAATANLMRFIPCTTKAKHYFFKL